MIDQLLQTSLDFLKEIWFQLNAKFGLEETEAFKFLKPYLLQLQDNPVYMGVSLAALFLVPYALIKVRSISKKREHKLDELMEEMEDEEEFDEDDPRRLRRPDPESSENDELDEKPLFALDTPEEAIGEDSIIEDDELEGIDFDEDSALEEFEFEPADSKETNDQEETTEPVEQIEGSDFDKDLSEFMAAEQDSPDVLDAIDTADALTIDEEPQFDAPLEELPAEDSFSNYSERDEDEQDKAIKDLQEEMERTINQLAQQIDEPNEVPNTIKNLSEIHIGGDTLIDEEYNAPEKDFYLEDTVEKIDSDDPTQEEPTPVEETSSELSDAEILASLEAETKEVAPKTTDYEADPQTFSFKAESEVPSDELKYEAETSSEDTTYESEPVNNMDKPFSNGRSALPADPIIYPSSENTDNLIDRLKFLQTRFENRHQSPLESSDLNTKKTPSFDAEGLTEPRSYPSPSANMPPDSKKYMDLLESFIFMKDQKKHK